MLLKAQLVDSRCEKVAMEVTAFAFQSHTSPSGWLRQAPGPEKTLRFVDVEHLCPSLVETRRLKSPFNESSMAKRDGRERSISRRWSPGSQNDCLLNRQPRILGFPSERAARHKKISICSEIAKMKLPLGRSFEGGLARPSPPPRLIRSVP